MHLVSWDSYYLFSGGSSATVDGDAKGEIRVYLESQNYANNTSYVRLDHYIYTKNMQYGWSAIASATSKYRVTGPNGSTSYQTKSKSNIGYPTDGYILLGSTYHAVSHDVSGGGTFTVNGTINVVWGTGTSRTRTTDFYVTIPTIPRQTSITNFYTQNITLTSFSFVVTASDAIDWVQHSLNGGAWTDSGNQVISGLQPGTQYSLRTRVRRTSSGLWTESGTIYATTTQVAQITPSNVNFNIDDGITFAFTNPSGSTVDLYLESPNGTNRVTRTGITTPYTLSLSEGEKNILFGLAPSSNSLAFRFRLRTAGNNNYNHYRTGTASITNANPTFNNFTYADTNSVTTTLTGNSQRIIKGYSNLRARITSANKMVAVKGATAKEYQLVVGSKQIKADYHASNNVDLTLNAIDNNVFIVYAIDSRGNSTQKQISPSTYIDYFKPIISEVKVSRQNNISTLTNLSFSGTFFNAGFGAVNNTLTATYQYRNTQSETWKNGTTPLNLSVNGNNFSCNRSIAGDLNASGFNISESFEIRVKVTDKLATEERSEILVNAKPNIDLHKDGTSINNPYDESLGHGVQLNGENIYYNGMLLFGWSDE